MKSTERSSMDSPVITPISRNTSGDTDRELPEYSSRSSDSSFTPVVISIGNYQSTLPAVVILYSHQWWYQSGITRVLFPQLWFSIHEYKAGQFSIDQPMHTYITVTIQSPASRTSQLHPLYIVVSIIHVYYSWDTKVNNHNRHCATAHGTGRTSPHGLPHIRLFDYSRSR